MTRWDHRERTAALARSPLFDLEYYEAQSNEAFQTKKDAAEHFLRHGAAAGYSPTPLYNEEWYGFHTGLLHEAPRFCHMFFHNEPLNTTSPLFDARVYVQKPLRRGGARLISLRDALEQFVAHATPDTVLPVHDFCAGTPTWGEARAEALKTSARYWRRTELNRERFSTEWHSGPLPELPPRAAGSALVSVVMPVRDRATVISAAIESVLAQSYPDWELIVVDDGSTDSTPDVVQRYSERDPRVHLVRGPAAGVCAARNSGIAAAEGRYIAFLDSDNVWVPELLEHSVAALETGNAVAVYAAVEMKKESGENRFLAIHGSRDDLLYGGNFVDLNTLVVRSEAIAEIGGFDESLRRWVDYDLAIRLFALGPVELLPFIGVIYSESTGTGRISTVEAPGWEQVVLSKYLLDWAKIEAAVPARVPGRVSIVIPSYADWRHTLPAVRSVLAHSGNIDIEIVVVDNGSPRSPSEILAAGLLGANQVRLLPLERNTNFALGSNLGFALGTGEYTLFLNCDTEVGEDWLAPLLSALNEAGADGRPVTAVQPLVLNDDGSVQSAGLRFERGEPIPHDLLTVPSEVTEIDGVSGVAMLLRSADFAAVHGFDPIFSNGYDDADFSLRLATAGHADFRVVPNSRVRHFQLFSPGRFAADANNRRLLAARWPELFQPSGHAASRAR
ncbi:glycosyltransferase family 2 protein [Microterricola viridarii]|nr:glycosyltransferase family 2 protein [Microterricola viridarii]